MASWCHRELLSVGGKNPGRVCGSEGRVGPAVSDAAADARGPGWDEGWLFGDLDKCGEDTSQPEWAEERLCVEGGGTQIPISGSFYVEGVGRGVPCGVLGEIMRREMAQYVWSGVGGGR